MMDGIIGRISLFPGLLLAAAFSGLDFRWFFSVRTELVSTFWFFDGSGLGLSMDQVLVFQWIWFSSFNGFGLGFSSDLGSLVFLGLDLLVLGLGSWIFWFFTDLD